MRFQAVAITLVFLTAFGSARGEEHVGPSYEQLRRLLAVLDLPSFPSPSADGVQTWKQETQSSGVAHIFDFNKFPHSTVDEIPMSSFVQFWGGWQMENDLDNVVIISDNGKSIRFVDFNYARQDVALRKGDVIAFLIKQKVK